MVCHKASILAYSTLMQIIAKYVSGMVLELLDDTTLGRTAKIHADRTRILPKPNFK